MKTFTKSICVFCGSRDGDHPAYRDAATDLGHALVENDMRLVYGGGNIGLMGAVATAVQDQGGHVLGIIPEHLKRIERIKADQTPIIVTGSMHERKKVMFHNSDAIVLLPGGAGSLDEFFEVLTWAQIGLHNKPVIVVNIAGYWDPMITLLNHVIASGFASETLHDHFKTVASVPEVMDVLTA